MHAWMCLCVYACMCCVCMQERERVIHTQGQRHTDREKRKGTRKKRNSKENINSPCILQLSLYIHSPSFCVLLCNSGINLNFFPWLSAVSQCEALMDWRVLEESCKSLSSVPAPSLLEYDWLHFLSTCYLNLNYLNYF